MSKQELPDFHSDAFISYAHQDGIALAQFAEAALTSAGIVTYRDAYDLEYGPELLKRLVLALERAKTVVAIVTPAYLGSEWCKGELFIGAAYNNVICVLADGVSHDQLPFKLETGLAVYQRDLQSDADCLQKFCTSVFSIGEKRKTRTGFDGRPLPSLPGAPVHVLNMVSNRTYALFTTEAGKRRLKIAAETLEACELEGVHDAYAEFSNPQTMIAGLVSLQTALDAAPREQEAWRALWRLARPFNKQVETYAFYMANLSANELREERAPVTRDVALRVAARRKTKPLPKRLQQQIDQIQPVTDRIKRTDGPVVEKKRQLATRDRLNGDWRSGWERLAHAIMAFRFPSFAPKVRTHQIDRAPLEPSSEDPRAANLFVVFAIIAIAGAAVGNYLSEHRAKPASPDRTEEGGIVEPVAAEAPFLPAYCDVDRQCVFPQKSSLWKVAADCFGDGRRWPEIWKLNNATLDKDPDKVVSGQAFILPDGGCVASNQ
jgi:nucleoid-associated protein YgaU